MWTRTPIGGLSHGMASLGRGTFMTDTPLGRLLGKMGFGKSGTVGGPAHVAGGAQPGGGAPAGPAWFQPGYRLPPGIQSAIASGDYGSAYGQAPPSADRFAQNSGTGNWQADQATKAFQLSGGYPGPANHPGVSDRGHDRFYGGPAMTADDQGGFAAADQSGDPAAAAATTAGAAARYQAALKAVPMGPGGYTAGYAQQLNDWIAQNGGGASTVTGTPNVTTPYSFLSLLNKPPFAGGPASGGARGPISISPPPIAGA
jgi:hypothetical protein